jgi:hypothetical protein
MNLEHNTDPQNNFCPSAELSAYKEGNISKTYQ